MYRRPQRLPSLVSVIALVLLVPSAGSTQTGEEDTLPRTALTLSARQISVFYDSSLQANDLAHRSVLETSSGEASEVRLERLEGHRALRLGPLGPESGDDPPPSGPNHELWLVRNGSTWSLDARPPANEDEEQDAGGTVQIPLQHLV
jgi:hypothetical protein